VLDVSSKFIPWALLPGRVQTTAQIVTRSCELCKSAATAVLYVVRIVQ
jgi:hypothetical protein